MQNDLKEQIGKMETSMIELEMGQLDRRNRSAGVQSPEPVLSENHKEYYRLLEEELKSRTTVK